MPRSDGFLWPTRGRGSPSQSPFERKSAKQEVLRPAMTLEGEHRVHRIPEDAEGG